MRPLLVLLFCSLFCNQAVGEEVPGPFASFDRASAEVLNDPHDLVIGPDGRLYVADKFGAGIAVMDAETLELIEVRENGNLPGVHDISFGSDGRAAIAVTGLGAVLVFDRFAIGASKPTQILKASGTEGALVHTNGRIYAMAGGTGTLLAYENGNVVASTEGHFGAHDVAEGPDGSIWVADNFNRRLVRYSPELKQLQIIDHAKFGFAGPRYLDIDELGRLIVADQDAHRVLMIDPNGEDGGSLVGVIGTGVPGKGPNLLDDPEGVAVHGNRYYFSDSDNNRIVRYSVVTN